MDLENFTFRPMTKGLGFDKQADELKVGSSAKLKPASPPKKSSVPPMESITSMGAMDQRQNEDDKNERPVSQSLQKMLDSLPPSIDWVEDKKRDHDFLKIPTPPAAPVSPQTVLRSSEPELKKTVETPRPKNREFDVTLNNSISKAFPKNEFSKPFFYQTVTPQVQFKEIPMSFASAVIDGLAVLLLTALFVVTLITLTGIDVYKMTQTAPQMNRVLMEVGILYVGILALYYMISRSLWGATAGDFAFDIRLGTEAQRRHVMYPFQVLFRILVILVTGVITIPLVSLGFGRDIAKKFSGLNLFCRQY